MGNNVTVLPQETSGNRIAKGAGLCKPHPRVDVKGLGGGQMMSGGDIGTWRGQKMLGGRGTWGVGGGGPEVSGGKEVSVGDRGAWRGEEGSGGDRRGLGGRGTLG